MQDLGCTIFVHDEEVNTGEIDTLVRKANGFASSDGYDDEVIEYQKEHPDFHLEPLRDHIRRRRGQLTIKRGIDIAGALLLIVLTAPLMLVVAALIKVTSMGPVIFTQHRPGLNGTAFRVFKFRSMYVGSVAGFSEIKERFSRAGDQIKLANDPRVTPLGRYLRLFSIDELPQLFNVLSGSMSLIGPRPLPPHMLEPYPDFLTARGLVRPGMSGLWQVRERSKNTNARYMMGHDLEYVATFSLWLDLKIALRTVPAVLIHRSTV
jgi:exopolysaccharide production protein ExoY